MEAPQMYLSSSVGFYMWERGQQSKDFSKNQVTKPPLITSQFLMFIAQEKK